MARRKKARPIFRFTIHRVGVKKPLKRGEVRKKKLEQAVKTLQRKIRKHVTKQHIPMVLKVWEADDETNTFSKQYDTKHDFRTFKKVPKWRKTLSRKVRYGHKTIVPVHWYVALGKRGQIDITKLAYEPKKGTLLKRKRKRLFGPFESEEAAIAFRDRAMQRIRDRAKTTEFTQHRRWKGPIDEAPSESEGDEEEL